MISLSILNSTLAICKLPAKSPIPAWAMKGEFCSATRTPTEVSLVCGEEYVPGQVQAERGWRAIMVNGALDFSLTGIFAGLAGALAKAQISLFAMSTYDTDYILVKADTLAAAVEALRAAGYEIYTL